MTPRGRTLIVGAYGYGNVGDEAILSGLLTRFALDSVTVVSRNPAETRRMHGVVAIDAGAAVGALRTHGSVIIGGGGLFGADMGRIGRLLPLFGIGAATLGRSVSVEGVDIDEELKPAARWLVPALLRRARSVTVRDAGSRMMASRMGVAADVVPDLSALMSPASAGTGRAWLASSGVDFERPVIGLALTAVRPELVASVLAACAEAMDALSDADFCFIPMSRHPTVAGHDDLRLGRMLGAMRPRLRIVEERAHPATVLAGFGQLGSVIAMRYHGMLFAERMGVPLVPIVYAEKNRRWLADRALDAVAPTAADLTAGLRNALPSPPRTELAGVAP